MKMLVFISSVQKEFENERMALRAFLQGDALLSKFFDPFLFEDVPATSRRPGAVYLDKVEQSEVYIGLFGNEYGSTSGKSATEQEFERASQLNKLRLIYVKGPGSSDAQKDPRMQSLIQLAGAELIRRRFANKAELIAAVYASLVQFLEERELIRTGPFDASPCPKATMADLDEDRMRTFIHTARRARGFALSEEASQEELLTHLNLLDKGRPTHAAVLLFGKQPQRFLISSEIKCAHYHGTEVAKPIPSYQVYKGTVFDLVDQAVDFVMSKINLSVGTRAEGPQAPVSYEIPREVVAEAIVNAVAHRDYAHNGSVQVMLFTDRLEVWNPGSLPPTLTLAMLREPHGSVPGNPLLAEPLYLAKYIERMGTGTRDMIRRCREAGLPEPEFLVRDGFVTILRRPSGQVLGRPESQPESQPESLELRVLHLLVSGPHSKAELSEGLGQKEISGQLNKVVRILLSDQTIEYTIPDKPNSRLQKYRLTDKGRQVLQSLRDKLHEK